MCATYAYIDHQNHPNVGINGSPMECLGIYIYIILCFLWGVYPIIRAQWMMMVQLQACSDTNAGLPTGNRTNPIYEA